MKKYIAIIAGIFLGISLGLASAQQNGQICVSGGQQGVFQGGICIPIGGGNNPVQPPVGGSGAVNCPAGTIPQNVNGRMVCIPQTGGNMPNPTSGTGGYGYSNPNAARQMGQQGIDFGFFQNIIMGTGGLVKLLPPILLGIAVVVFFFFLIKYLIAGEAKAEEKQKALKSMMYSLGAIFIMVCLWGIIAFFGDMIGLRQDVTVSAPTLPIR